MNYSIQSIYMISHLVIGSGINIFEYRYHKYLWGLIFSYQILQLIFGIRFFIFNYPNLLGHGNSIPHTINKLGQYSIGYNLGFLLKKLKFYI